MKLFTLSNGNKKLKNTMIFNIPSVSTCPGRTKQCEKSCYATKAEVQYPATLPSRKRNFDLTQHDDFADLFILELERHLGKKRVETRFFRIHESGDFYNQVYFDKWVKICASFPHIRFLAFTKSWHLDFSAAPENLRLRYSVWEDTKHIRLDLPLALMEGVGKRGKTLLCKPGFECGGSKRCRYCWVTDQDVMFHLH